MTLEPAQPHWRTSKQPMMLHKACQPLAARHRTWRASLQIRGIKASTMLESNAV